MEAGLKRWRLFSIRYGKERVWVERWLHMISRSLARQPAAASELVQTATMIQGYGDVYRQGLADWNAIIDGLRETDLRRRAGAAGSGRRRGGGPRGGVARSAAGGIEAQDRRTQGANPCRRERSGGLMS